MNLQQIVTCPSEMVTQVHVDTESISIVDLGTLINLTLLSAHKPRLLIPSGLKIGLKLKTNALTHTQSCVTSHFASAISNQGKSHLCKDIPGEQTSNIKVIIVSKLTKEYVLCQKVCVSSGAVCDVDEHLQLRMQEGIPTNTIYKSLNRQDTTPEARELKTLTVGVGEHAAAIVQEEVQYRIQVIRYSLNQEHNKNNYNLL